MREIGRLSLVLFIISGIAALLLGATNYVTKDVIAEQIRLENEKARMEVLGDAEEFQQLDEDLISAAAQSLGFDNLEVIEEVYEGISAGQAVGYTFKSVPRAYGGEITVLTGISIDGTVTGMRIVSHTETPGLGAKATDGSFMAQFENQSATSPLQVIKSGTPGQNEISAITGATITTEAIAQGVNYSIEMFNELNK
ncbi:RnfABCDGE type electron transport complex subunit G [Alkalibacter saccharofermentans]|jgi:electron transport complex protein RnfG|uniref:Ion-translocating oxidoreductase complex subunit G n=1 Tax=Alkalibacter saccharofermentans DSM 14828 TaxID=1120975 RepID=A0A1M4VG53_9FIRM|nr:RnfABCDGE type electron transport complex subunit G [Alkalibacter saccharofermentans]SHE67918.1 electron transport complex protein RnfG [Alkalibacter saccharofermentans DSM 14828]